MKRCIITVTAVILLLSASRSNEAEARPGLRLGVTDDPDTLFAGFFYEVPVSRLGRSGWLSIEPGIDVGAGDVGHSDYFMIRGSFNAKFIFMLNQDVQFYPLVGLGVAYLNADNFDETDVGIDLGLGFQFDRFAFELWGDLDNDNVYPDITFLFSIAF